MTCSPQMRKPSQVAVTRADLAVEKAVIASAHGPVDGGWIGGSEHSSAGARHGIRAPQLAPGPHFHMIRLDSISKQNGHQILFIEASAALQKGEKVALVGPNGAGKTTLFRMITGREIPDEGQVAVDRGVTIGYFSQDVGEMSGRSAG